MPEVPTVPKVVVIGTGYVGLPAALLLARSGCDVVGVDIDRNIVRAINDGMLHIREDELDALMKNPEVRRHLIAQDTACPGDVFLIAVPTPLDHQKKVADLSYVVSAVESILPHLRAGNLVILESTVPPLTCRRMITPMIEGAGFNVGREVFLAHCPERILPGDIFREIVHNDRIIGGVNDESGLRARDVYARFVEGELLVTDDVTAELAKLMENTHRDVNIALSNEFASVAEGLGVDPLVVIALANRHPRVNILKPGIGVGGHCICLDPWFIKEVDPANSRLIFTARQINDERPHTIAARIRAAVRSHRNGRIVAVGAAYKADTPDVRESPAVEVVQLLREDGYDVAHYDPLVEGMAYDSLAEACTGAVCLVILVEHTVVREELMADAGRIHAAMAQPLVLRFYDEGGAAHRSGRTSQTPARETAHRMQAELVEQGASSREPEIRKS